MTAAESDVPFLLLRAASQLVDGIQAGVLARGFADVRPAHGFAFVRISSGDATVSDVAEHLGVTKQAASQLVEQLVVRGYVRRDRDEHDGRVLRLSLTRRGRACAQAAEEAAAELVRSWRGQVGARRLGEVQKVLQTVVEPGALRPTW